MGNRAVVVFTDESGDKSPGIYLHWSGSEVKSFLENAAPAMRKGDLTYAAARFCGYCHTQIEGALSLGIIDPPKSLEPDYLSSFDGYSHGNAGVFVVNVETGAVINYGGYDDECDFTLDNLYDG